MVNNHGKCISDCVAELPISNLVNEHCQQLVSCRKLRISTCVATGVLLHFWGSLFPFHFLQSLFDFLFLLFLFFRLSVKQKKYFEYGV